VLLASDSKEVGLEAATL